MPRRRETWGSFAFKGCQRQRCLCCALLWGNFGTPRSHSSAEVQKLVRNPRKPRIERLKVPTWGLSTPLLHIDTPPFQLVPLGNCRLILQGVGRCLLQERRCWRRGWLSHSRKGLRHFQEWASAGKNTERTVNVILAAVLVREILHYVEPQVGGFLSLCKESTMWLLPCTKNMGTLEGLY